MGQTVSAAKQIIPTEKLQPTPVITMADIAATQPIAPAASAAATPITTTEPYSAPSKRVFYIMSREEESKAFDLLMSRLDDLKPNLASGVEFKRVPFGIPEDSVSRHDHLVIFHRLEAIKGFDELDWLDGEYNSLRRVMKGKEFGITGWLNIENPKFGRLIDVNGEGPFYRMNVNIGVGVVNAVNATMNHYGIKPVTQ